MAKVLLIEDDVVQRDLYRDLLYYNGFDVLVAEDAGEGIPLAVAERPDVILMDVMLPGMDGLTAAKRLGEHPATAQIPVICMSAYDVSAQKAVRSAAREVLAKPIDPSILVKTIWRHSGGPP